MPEQNDAIDSKDFKVGNYCVSFIDLLGQRDALHGQGLLPRTTSEDERQALYKTLRASIGSIATLQRQAEAMLESSAPKQDSPLRAQLPPELQAQWDQMQRTHITNQRWSDGLMAYTHLGQQEIKCHLNSVFRLFALAGTLCFVGLASRKPLRGAMEIAWGIELHPGELYGAAVARAYELESEVASYPRIVIGPELLRFLNLKSRNPNTDIFAQNDRELANLCLEMIMQDADGHWFLHYLGNAFQKFISGSGHMELYSMARAFIFSQLTEYQAKKNSKLAFRYLHLLHYFDAHPVSGA